MAAGFDAALGSLLRERRFAEAEALCRQALAARPQDATAWTHLANVLDELGRLDEAEAAYRRAVALRPDLALAHYNLGLLLQGQRRLEAAEAAYACAASLRPDLAQAHNNRGAALRDLHRLPEAIAAFDAALALKPDYADAQFNQAMCRLMVGDYQRGWGQYEWRWRMAQAQFAQRGFAQPLWLGREDIAGRTLLLHAEQGFGDTLQFCRFAPDVAALGARVILEVQPGLERLLAGLEGVSAVVRRGDRLPAFDAHTPLMSLPLALGVQPDGFAARVPYLAADESAAAEWAQRLAHLEGLKVGLVWAGAARADQPIAAAVDKRRSLPLSALAPLADVAGVSLVSLQLGPPAAQLRDASAPGRLASAIFDPTAALSDFADTAALLANLDLLITCDTAAAHLAGATGKPVWILSRYDGCWRWLLERDDSPWYPSARLFRQAAPGDWSRPVGRVAAALAALTPAR